MALKTSHKIHDTKYMTHDLWNRGNRVNVFLAAWSDE